MNNITSAVGLNTKSQTDQKEAVTVFLLACTYTQIQEICNKQSTERKYQLFSVDNFSFKKCHETPPHRAANFTCRKRSRDNKICIFLRTLSRLNYFQWLDKYISKSEIGKLMLLSAACFFFFWYEEFSATELARLKHLCFPSHNGPECCCVWQCSVFEIFNGMKRFFRFSFAVQTSGLNLSSRLNRSPATLLH